MAEEDGATRVEGKIAEVELDGESGNIAALKLESGQRIEGDLFIDCTGFRALLIDGDAGLEVRGLDSLAAQRQRDCDPDSLGAARRFPTRWRSRTIRAGSGGFRCSTAPATASSSAAAISTRTPRSSGCSAKSKGDTLTQPNVLRFKAGVRPRQWVKNCVAVGLSSGFMEPLESTSIHLIQRAVLRLIRMLPLAEVSERDILEFNDQMLQDYLQIRDFLILHYKATDRRDSEFWRYCADDGRPRQPDPEDRAVPRDRPSVPPQRGIVRREQLGAGDDGAGDHAANPIIRSQPSLAMRK